MRLLLLSVLSLVLCGCVQLSQVSAYPSQEVVDQYRVSVDGVSVGLHSAMSDDKNTSHYYFGSFEFTGEVEVRVWSAKPLNNVQVRPAKFGIEPKVLNDHELVFRADKPFRISIEREGKVEPLLLFGEAPEVDAPKQGDKNVVYYGPGEHKAGLIKLESNQTLYLAPGAVVHGAIYAKGENITIRGRGILDGKTYPRFKGPRGWVLSVDYCRNVVVKDIIMRNPWSWMLVVNQSDDVLIENVKICGARMINDDATDFCNSRNIVMRKCFMRTRDDIVAIKGLGRDRKAKACENILIEDCEFWTDSANIFRIGYECNAEAMRNIVARNIDVLHYSRYVPPSNYWSHAIFWLQPSNGMTLSDCHFEDFRIYCDGADMMLVCAKMMLTARGREKYTEYGNTRNCTFKDIAVIGTRGAFRGQLYFHGASEKAKVDGMFFDNITYFGEKVTKDSPCVEIVKFADNIHFK